MRDAVFAEFCFLELVVEPLALGDAERIANSLIVGTKAHEASGNGLVGTMTFTDRKSTRLNSSHQIISYAVFCLKKKKQDSPCRRCSPQHRSPQLHAHPDPS